MYFYVVLMSVFMGSIFSLNAMLPDWDQRAKEMDQLRRDASDHYKQVRASQLQYSSVLREDSGILQEGTQT